MCVCVCAGVGMCVWGCMYVYECVCVRKEGAKIVVETFFFFFQVFRTNEAAEASIETKNFSFGKKSGLESIHFIKKIHFNLSLFEAEAEVRLTKSPL